MFAHEKLVINTIGLFANSVTLTTHGCRGFMNHGVLYINPTSTWDVRQTEEAVILVLGSKRLIMRG